MSLSYDQIMRGVSKLAAETGVGSFGGGATHSPSVAGSAGSPSTVSPTMPSLAPVAQTGVNGNDSDASWLKQRSMPTTSTAAAATGLPAPFTAAAATGPRSPINSADTQRWLMNQQLNGAYSYNGKPPPVGTTQDWPVLSQPHVLGSSPGPGWSPNAEYDLAHPQPGASRFNPSSLFYRLQHDLFNTQMAVDGGRLLNAGARNLPRLWGGATQSGGFMDAPWWAVAKDNIAADGTKLLGSPYAKALSGVGRFLGKASPVFMDWNAQNNNLQNLGMLALSYGSKVVPPAYWIQEARKEGYGSALAGFNAGVKPLWGKNSPPGGFELNPLDWIRRYPQYRAGYKLRDDQYEDNVRNGDLFANVGATFHSLKHAPAVFTEGYKADRAGADMMGRAWLDNVHTQNTNKTLAQPATTDTPLYKMYQQAAVTDPNRSRWTDKWFTPAKTQFGYVERGKDPNDPRNQLTYSQMPQWAQLARENKYAAPYLGPGLAPQIAQWVAQHPGTLQRANVPPGDMWAVTKAYYDAEFNRAMNRSGGTMLPQEEQAALIARENSQPLPMVQQ